MDNRTLARATRKAFKLLLSESTIKARHGSNHAARNVMRYLAAENHILRNLGYIVSNENQLVSYKKWKADPRNQAEIKRNELAIRVMEGDVNAATELLESFSTGT